MKYKYLDTVITKDGKVGTILQVYEHDNRYFVRFEKFGTIYHEDDITEWHGCW